MNRRYVLVLASAALGLLAWACDSGTAETSIASSTSTTDSTPTIDPAVDRLVVLDGAGNIVTMNRDGGDVTALMLVDDKLADEN